MTLSMAFVNLPPLRALPSWRDLRVICIDYATQNALKIETETTHFIVRWRRVTSTA